MEASAPFREHGFKGRGMQLFNVTVALTTAACVFVIARISAKTAAGKRFGWDDVVITTSLVSLPIESVHQDKPNAPLLRVR